MDTSLDARIKHPFNMLISGPTQSGKTTWVLQLLLYASDLLEVTPKRVFWHSPNEEIFHHSLSINNLEVIYKKNLPWISIDKKRRSPSPKNDGGIPIANHYSDSSQGNDDNESFDENDDLNEEESIGKSNNPKNGDLIIIDDFAQETSNSKDLTSFITRHSHHRGISIIVLTQNLFWSGKETRTQSINMHYIVLMRQSRDHRQIRTLGRQLTQNQSAYNVFLQAYNDATDTRPFSYLLISLHPRDDKRLLLRTNIFPEEASSATIYLQQPPSKKKKYK